MGELQYAQRTYSPLSHGLMSAASLSEVPRTFVTGPSATPFPSEYHSGYPSAQVAFTKPPAAASNLLTPTSSSMASPPMHPNQLHHDPHYANSYQQPGTPHTQGGTTPPPTQGMYYQQALDPYSQTSSPMPNHGILPPEILSNRQYNMDDQRGPPSPREYLGSYGVSASHSSSDISQSYLYPVVRSEPHAYPIGLNPESSRHLVPLSLPGQPQPPQPRPSRQRGADAERLPETASDSRSTPGESASRRASQPSRVRKRSSRKASTSRSFPAATTSSSAEHLDCHGEERQPQLKPDTPPEEKLIMELRWRYRKAKGQDMWDSIQREYRAAFKKDCGKEQLQMKYSRARARYFEWQERDIHLLLEAYLEVERSRYSMILDKFLESGGSRNMQLSASDIEAKLVNDLKIEEGLYVEHPAKSNLKVRRRRKLSARARQGKKDDNNAETLREEATLLGGLRQSTDPDEVLHQIQKRDSQAGLWDETSGLSPEMTSCHVHMKREPGVDLSPSWRAC